MNTKVIIIPIVIGIALVLGVIVYPLGEGQEEIIPKSQEIIIEPDEPTSVPDETNHQNGVVEGVVYYVGIMCPSSRTGPPCDGPYPNYEVVIFEVSGESVIARTFTDNNGNFEAELPPGDYIVFGKNPGFNTVEETPIFFTIEPEKRKSIEILINEGYR